MICFTDSTYFSEGNYVIVVAYMSTVMAPVRPSLQDYVQPTVDSLDSGCTTCFYFSDILSICLGIRVLQNVLFSLVLIKFSSFTYSIADSELIEEASRISLNCPIRYAISLVRKNI